MPREWFRSFFDAEYLALLKDQWTARATRAQVDFLVKALQLRPPARVLDVACGYGRHAFELARRGYEVVGVDLSAPMLREARRLGRGRKNPRFLRGDMRALDFRGEFDAAYSMFTSFGYFSHAQNVGALRQIVRAVRPGGRVLLDVRNLDHDKDHVANRNWWKRGSRFVLEEHRLDPKTGVVENRWWTSGPSAGPTWTSACGSWSTTRRRGAGCCATWARRSRRSTRATTAGGTPVRTGRG